MQCYNCTKKEMDYFKNPKDAQKALYFISNFLPKPTSKYPNIGEVYLYIPAESIIEYMQIPSSIDAYIVYIGKNSRGEKYFKYCSPLSIKNKDGIIGIIYHKWSVINKLDIAKNGAAITSSQVRQLFPLKDIPIQLGSIHTQGNREFIPISKEEIIEKITNLCKEYPSYKKEITKISFSIEGYKCRLKKLYNSFLVWYYGGG